MKRTARSIVAAVVAATVFMLPSSAQAADPTTVYAHRGGDTWGPDNSLAALVGAMNAGYSIELDVRPSSDGAAWLAHDDAYGAGCNASGKISTTHSRQLAAVVCNGQRLTTLAEVLRYAAAHPVAGRRILVETKTGTPAEADAILRAVTQYDVPGVIVESFWWASLAHVEAMAPEIDTCALWNDASATSAALVENVDMLCPYYTLATPGHRRRSRGDRMDRERSGARRQPASAGRGRHHQRHA